VVYIFDIDGVICDTKNKEYKKSKPYQDRIQKINKLYDSGHTIMFHTSRGMLKGTNRRDLAESKFWLFTAKQLDGWGVKYHNLVLGKPIGDVYIDQKGLENENFFGN
jgi:hypothetical protein